VFISNNRPRNPGHTGADAEPGGTFALYDPVSGFSYTVIDDLFDIIRNRLF
jgi:hypothetical protein